MPGYPTMLAIDMVLGALIGPPGHPTEALLDDAEAGELTPVVLDLALFSAVSSVRSDDAVDHARFARLLRCARLGASRAREGDAPLPPPSAEEIEHWRGVVFGRDDDAE